MEFEHREEVMEVQDQPAPTLYAQLFVKELKSKSLGMARYHVPEHDERSMENTAVYGAYITIIYESFCSVEMDSMCLLSLFFFSVIVNAHFY
jgi:hypothetical protein